jgi:hypothetical protein
MRAVTALLVLLLVACGHRKTPSNVVPALERLASAPSKMVLYSLDPYSHHDGELYTDTLFKGYDILGKAEISDTSEQQALLRALARGASEADDNAALCFNPRHALHIEQNGRSLDFTICFECFRVEARGFESEGFYTSRTPTATFDQSLQMHRVPRALK